MTEDQLHQIDQARRYAEQDEYVVTRTHIRNLLAIIEQPTTADGWKLVPVKPTLYMEQVWHAELLNNPTFWGAWAAAVDAAPEPPTYDLQKLLDGITSENAHGESWREL